MRAWCEKRGAMRTFKICRMDEVELLHSGFDPALFSTEGEETGPKMENGGGQAPLRIVLRFAPQMAYQVYDLFPHSTVIKEEDGSLTVRACAPDAEWLYSMLLQYGTNVRVLSPPQVRENCFAVRGRLFHFMNPIIYDTQMSAYFCYPECNLNWKGRSSWMKKFFARAAECR